MRLPTRDIIATTAVAVAVLLWALWVADATLSGLSSDRATGLAVLVLGFVASASAVVPGFGDLMHGNKSYLAGTSVLGLLALIAGIVTLVSPSSTALALLVAALAALWVISTWHHLVLAKHAPSPRSHMRLAG
jgi:hypothetical protein